MPWSPETLLPRCRWQAGEIPRRRLCRRRLAEWLTCQGHDVLFTDDLGTDSGDRALLEIAAKEGRAVVTIDMDFGELIFLHGVSHAGLIRLPDVPARERLALVEDVLNRYGEILSRRAVVTASRQRIRVSVQPETTGEG